VAIRRYAPSGRITSVTRCGEHRFRRFAAGDDQNVDFDPRSAR
jgi:hypothetical protein